MKINDVRIAAEGKDGTKFEYKAVATVTTDGGRFTVELHEDLCEIAEKMHHPGMSVEFSYSKWRVSGHNLRDIVRFIESCASEHLTCETKVERVIVYGYKLWIHFWLEPDGTIQPNGAGREGAWFKGSYVARSTECCSHYSVGFAARVLDKTSHIRKTGTNVTYELVRESKDEAIDGLNSFVRLDIGDSDRGLGEDYKEMPYTPDAAKFFYGVMVNLCKLSKSIHEFFGDEPKLIKAINAGKLLEFK